MSDSDKELDDFIEVMIAPFSIHRKKYARPHGTVARREFRNRMEKRINALIEKKVREARLDGGTTALAHAEKLRHAVRVDHWGSSCENCRENIVGTPKNCPRCKYSFDYFTTMYPDEKEAAQGVFPELPYLDYYDYGLITLQDNQAKEGV